MLQRVVRQIRECLNDADITIATSSSQKEAIIAQLGSQIDIVCEPSRRDTFPAIALATSYLRSEKNIPENEPVIVMPCDPFTESGYFVTIREMSEEVAKDNVNLVLMGITPNCPSSKFGYMLPKKSCKRIEKFIEKPEREAAESLIKQGALWNGGVFAFRLGYLASIITKYFSDITFNNIFKGYDRFPKISFDYEVVEKESMISFIPFKGRWKDLGTWDSLSSELNEDAVGNALLRDCEHTSVINELAIPVVCKGVNNLIVALSPDGVLVAEKSLSGQIKDDVEGLKTTPKFEEKSWGNYSTIDHFITKDNIVITTKRFHMMSRSVISEKCDFHQKRILMFLYGTGNIEINCVMSTIEIGKVVDIPENSFYTIHSDNSIEFIETEIKNA